jgi:hypothetical protein
LKKHNLANNIIHVSDGEEALDFIYARGNFKDRDIVTTQPPNPLKGGILSIEYLFNNSKCSPLGAGGYTE